MEVLITGGTGFLGQHLAFELLRRGDNVRLMGRDFGGAATVLAAGARPVLADLRDPSAVQLACAGVEVVYHAGALSAPWGAREDFYAVNVGGTAAVIDGCRARSVRRLMHVSSPSVVFDGRDQIEATEDAPYPRRFQSVYSQTKKLGEDLVNAARDLETVIVRPKAIFGPGDQSLLPRVVEAARRRRLPQIGGGQNLVDLTYVGNVVHALVLAANAPAAAGKTYTITNGDHIALWPLLRAVLRRLDVPSPSRRVPVGAALLLAAALEARAAMTGREPLLTRYTVAILARTQTYDIAAARSDLDYTPLVSVADGIERTISAMRAAHTPGNHPSL